MRDLGPEEKMQFLPEICLSLSAMHVTSIMLIDILSDDVRPRTIARGLLVFIRTDGQCVSVYVFVSALFIVPNSRTVTILWQTIIDNSGYRP